MMADLMPKKSYDLTEITRLLLEMRENCVPKAGNAYEDPNRAEKYDALNAAIDLINNPSIISRWISVKDRLPEDGVRVLVSANSKSDDPVVAVTHYTHSLYGFNIKGWVEPWQYFFFEHEITHWMPLPEPPKEES